jgi:hypothetical protein
VPVTWTTLPSAEDVTVAWALTVDLGGAPVVARVKETPDVWGATGIVVISGPVGGSPNRHVAMRHPVMNVEGWSLREACGPDADDPPARQLIERLFAASYNWTPRDTPLLLPDGMRKAHLHTVYPETEPRRLGDGTGGFDRFHIDLAVNWTWGEK